MLRVNVGLSRKLSKDYNSNGFSINIDGEVSAPTSDMETVMEQVKELFDLAEEALDLQIERSQGDSAMANRDADSPGHANRETSQPGYPAGQQSRARRPTSNGSGNGNGNGHTGGHHPQAEPATNRQINYLLNIGKRQRLSVAQLEKQLAEILGEPVELYGLTKQAAAVAIERLTNSSNGDRRTARY